MDANNNRASLPVDEILLTSRSSVFCDHTLDKEDPLLRPKLRGIRYSPVAPYFFKDHNMLHHSNRLHHRHGLAAFRPAASSYGDGGCVGKDALRFHFAIDRVGRFQ